ncbi:MAG TPA: hypothetical protein VEF34_10865 [Syntrophobacteraceae bacterium]|nr:hypothetical protein [Syntrophobacteraceae bacterium]
MAYRIESSDYPARILFGFTAGFIATLTLNQLTVLILWYLGLAPFNAYSIARNSVGVPQILSFAFWGGVWGILFSMVEHRFPVHRGYWVTAFLFGAVVLSGTFLLVVLPLKGQPVGGGWRLSLLLTVFLANGAWGIGTGLILEGLLRWFHRQRHVPV